MCYWPITILVILSASRIISMFLSVTITLIKNNSTNNFLAELVSSEHILDSKSLKALIMASSVSTLRFFLSLRLSINVTTMVIVREICVDLYVGIQHQRLRGASNSFVQI